MSLRIERCPVNPIVWPGKWNWRMSNAYNPAVIYDAGHFSMFERTAGSLRPHCCQIGLLESVDGVLWIYYGCCDTSISLATVGLNELVDHVLSTDQSRGGR